MDPILLFFVSFLIGFILAVVVWYLYHLKKERERQLEKEKLEKKIVSSLLELKKYTVGSVDVVGEKLSDKFDLIEVALENDISSITITSEEGLPVVSTIRDPDEISAKYSTLFQQAFKMSGDMPKKVYIKFEDYYIYIYPIVMEGNIFYAIVRSNFELDPANEKKLMRDILDVLERYI